MVAAASLVHQSLLVHDPVVLLYEVRRLRMLAESELIDYHAVELEVRAYFHHVEEVLGSCEVDQLDSVPGETGEIRWKPKILG